MSVVLLALLATAIAFVLGLFLLFALGDKAWSHAVALSVGIFFVVYFALIAEVAPLFLSRETTRYQNCISALIHVGYLSL